MRLKFKNSKWIAPPTPTEGRPPPRVRDVRAAVCVCVVAQTHTHTPQTPTRTALAHSTRTIFIYIYKWLIVPLIYPPFLKGPLLFTKPSLRVQPQTRLFGNTFVAIPKVHLGRRLRCVGEGYDEGGIVVSSSGVKSSCARCSAGKAMSLKVEKVEYRYRPARYQYTRIVCRRCGLLWGVMRYDDMICLPPQGTRYQVSIRVPGCPSPQNPKPTQHSTRPTAHSAHSTQPALRPRGHTALPSG